MAAELEETPSIKDEHVRTLLKIIGINFTLVLGMVFALKVMHISVEPLGNVLSTLLGSIGTLATLRGVGRIANKNQDESIDLYAEQRGTQ